MFGQLLKTSFISDLEKRAISAIKRDRDVYEPVRKTIRQFCKDNPVYVSNAVVLAGGEESYGPFDIYCDNPYKETPSSGRHLIMVAITRGKKQRPVYFRIFIINVATLIKKKRRCNYDSHHYSHYPCKEKPSVIGAFVIIVITYGFIIVR